MRDVFKSAMNLPRSLTSICQYAEFLGLHTAQTAIHGWMLGLCLWATAVIVYPQWLPPYGVQSATALLSFLIAGCCLYALMVYRSPYQTARTTYQAERATVHATIVNSKVSTL